jgi:hypothetical protein
MPELLRFDDDGVGASSSSFGGRDAEKGSVVFCGDDKVTETASKSRLSRQVEAIAIGFLACAHCTDSSAVDAMCVTWAQSYIIISSLAYLSAFVGVTPLTRR